jgi:hypothetical protein
MLSLRPSRRSNAAQTLPAISRSPSIEFHKIWIDPQQCSGTRNPRHGDRPQGVGWKPDVGRSAHPTDPGQRTAHLLAARKDAFARCVRLLRAPRALILDIVPGAD